MIPDVYAEAEVEVVALVLEVVDARHARGDRLVLLAAHRDDKDQEEEAGDVDNQATTREAKRPSPARIPVLGRIPGRPPPAHVNSSTKK